VHEHHAVKALVKQALERSGLGHGEKVTSLCIVMGELLGFDPDSVRLYFEEISRGTPAEGAELSFKAAEAALKCRSCGREFKRGAGDLCCPACRGIELTITGGKEFYIDSLEVESP
jgi:hydrogenase nickel incorporation protein HypA/HybF